MLASFDPLWQALLQGGVARRPARRYLAELQEHLDDLIAEERRTGIDEREARTRALQRLGDVEALAGAMIARKEFRSWGQRAPLATYVIAPPFILVACAAIAMVSIVIKASWLRHANGTPSDLPAWAHSLADGMVLFTNILLPVLLGWVLGATAIRQRSAPRWPMLGIAVLAATGAALQVAVTLPSATGHGEIAFAAGFNTLSDWIAYAGRFSLNLALTLTPYIALDRWRAAHVRNGLEA
jgi:hypothetical protein